MQTNSTILEGVDRRGGLFSIKLVNETIFLVSLQPSKCDYRMKKFLFLLFLLAVIAVTLMATCPDKKAHHEALKDVASKVINAEMLNSKIDESMASIGTMLAINVVDAYLSSNLILGDHTFYNIGIVFYKGEPQAVSVGVFNHVFTIDEDTAKEIIKDKISLPNLEDLQGF